MRWRCPVWRVLQPVQVWLPGYRAWLEQLIELPARIAATLDLQAAGAPAPAVAPDALLAPGAPVPPGIGLVGVYAEALTAGLWRLAGQGGPALITIASGALFGGVAAFFGRAWLAGELEAGGYVLFTISLGLVYGAGAIAAGVYRLARLAWGWGAPLRGIPAPRSSGRPFGS
jgi:hypothetical protein